MPFTINRRYNVRRDITGEGASSRVLLVEDALRGSRACALKLLRPLGEEKLTSARKEFETLRSIRHPFVAEVFDFGRVDEVEGRPPDEPPEEDPAKPGDFFITFSYVNGLNLRDAFLLLFPPGAEPPAGSPEAERRWRTFYEALAEIAIGLHAIHSRGLVHRDIKPENLLLVPIGPGSVPERFEVKIIDLDLAVPETTPLGTRLVGTLPYLAPEVLSGEFADPKSDLFSLGVSITAAIGGRTMDAGSGEEGISQAILTGAPLDLALACPAAPAALREVIGHLVRQESEERTPGALALVSELERIGGFSRLARIQGRGDIPTTGWERELALLASEVEALSQGEAVHSLVAIESDPCCFTDHFLLEVESAAQLKGLAFIAGRARRPARSPYPPFSEAIQKLIERIHFASPRYDRWRRALACFVPAGDGPTTGEPVSSLDLAEEKTRLFDSVSEFLIEAGRETPFILCLRGLSGADADTVELLQFLVREIALHRRDAEDEALFSAEGDGGPDPSAASAHPDRASRILVIAEYGESPAGGPAEGGAPADGPRAEAIAELTSQTWALSLKLAPLPQERIAEWIARRSPGPPPPPRLLQKIWEKCSGSPRLLDEIIRRTAMDRGRKDLSDEEEELETVLGLPDNLKDASLERLHRLEPLDRGLLDLLAAAHAPVPVRLLCGLAAGSPVEPRRSDEIGREAEVFARLRRLLDEGFITLEEGPEGLEAGWAMEALRDHVYRQMPEEKRVLHHRSLLEAFLPGADPPRQGLVPEEAAFHAERCGVISPFFRLALAAAEGYRRAHSTEPAIRLLLAVLGSLDSSPAAAERGAEQAVADAVRSDLRWTLNRDLGEFHRQRREYPRALEKYAVLLSLDEGGSGNLRRSEVYRRMGEIYSENRDPANALFFLEKSLEMISGLPPTREQVESLLALARFHLGRGQFKRAETSAERALDVLQRLHAPDLRFRASSLLAALAVKQNDHSRALALNLRMLAVVEGLGHRWQAMEVAGAIGENHMALGAYEKASESFQRAIEIAEELGAKHALSSFQNHLGTIHFNRAESQQALAHFRLSLRLRRELGDLKGIATSYNNLGLVFRVRDDLTRAARCYKKSIDLFSRLDDQNGMAAGMGNLADILELEGKYNEALDYCFRSLERRRRTNSRSGIAFSFYRIGKIYQSRGELEKAANFAEKGLTIRREIGEKMAIGYSHVQIAELLLLAGKVFEAYQESLAGQKEFELVENDLGRIVAREVQARVLIQMGALDRAAEILHDALDRARGWNQQYLVGTALIGLARVGLESGQFRDAEAHLARAEALFRENRNRREHAEALLLTCVLQLESGQAARAAETIERAYGILEELEIRDLVPWYFLLRGRIEMETPGAPAERAGKFLERGLAEAREVHLPDLAWQIHLHLALLQTSQGKPELAQNHVREAQEVLDAQMAPLPPELRRTFHETRSRRLLKRLVEAGRLGAVHPPPPAALLPAPAGAPAATGGEESWEVREIRSLNKKLLRLQEVSQAITSELSLERLLEKLMDAVMELVKAERGFLILRASEGSEDSITIARNPRGKKMEKSEIKVSRSISQEVVRTARPVLTTSALADKRFRDSRSIRDYKLQSILCVPLLNYGRVLGVIYIDNSLRTQAFGEEDLRVLLTFSAQAAIAITNARLSDELKLKNKKLTEANRQLATLNQRLIQQVNERTAELKAAREHIEKGKGGLRASWYFHDIVGKSKRMQEIFHVLDRISGTSLPVLIQGESGTGKELIANAIHRSSPRNDQRFISENCAALSETILESELFGHTRGAFTGAVAERKGLFELAHGGTLFLDEVGDMSLAMQKKLLRVLEEGEIRRVGGKDTIRVDVRIISASNQDLLSLVKAEKFREDLFYRLNGIRIELPPLRERKEDIPILIQHFLEQIAQESRQPLKSISPEALRLLLSYDWPGNVRELRHFLERTMLLATGSCIEERDCLFDQVIFKQESQTLSEGFLLELEKLPMRQARSGFMKHYLERIYEENGRNVTKAARACGISRESLHRLLKKLKVKGT